MIVAAINDQTLAELSKAGLIKGVHVFGVRRGWVLSFYIGSEIRRLVATHDRETRVFKSLEMVAVYLKDVGIEVFDVDAHGFQIDATGSCEGSSILEALNETHAEAAYERWFRRQVEAGKKEVADPSAAWISNDDVKVASQRRRAALRAAGTLTSGAPGRA